MTWLLLNFGHISTPAWALVGMLWMLGVLVFLLLYPMRPVTTVAWLLALWSFPLLALVAYVLFGPRRMNNERRARLLAKRAAARDEDEQVFSLPTEFVEQYPHYHTLARMNASSKTASYLPRRAKAIRLFADGDAAYQAIEQSIAMAQRYVHIEYYIYEPDAVGKRILRCLIERAAAGVIVRVVVDAIGASNCNEQFWTPLAKAGGHIKVFNPLSIGAVRPNRVNFRTHRKIVIVDGQTAFTGGLNISENNITKPSSGASPWRNSHVQIDGVNAQDLQDIFLQDWLYSTPISPKGLRRTRRKPLRKRSGSEDTPAEFSDRFGSSTTDSGPWVQIVSSGPDDPAHDIHRLYFSAINMARQRVWITTPYFVPDESILTALNAAVVRGIDVRLLIPAHGDLRLVDAATKLYARELVERGASCWLYTPVMNHSKTVVVDNDVSIVGTANFDNRSFRLNFEVAAVAFDSEFTAILSAQFEEDLLLSELIDCGSSLSIPQQLFGNAARLLSPML